MRKLLKRIGRKIPLNIQLIGLGILAFLFNWKTWAFYLLLIVVSVLAFLDQGITGLITAIAILYGLKFLGKLF